MIPSPAAALCHASVAERPVALAPVLGERHMTIFQPATPESNAIVRPLCPKCAAMMLLARIEPASPGHDRRTFECRKCGHSERVVVKFR